jgi:hypothetical protein
MWERRGRTAVGEKGRQQQRVSRSPVRGGWAARSPARGGWASLVAEPPGALVVGRTAARSPSRVGMGVVGGRTAERTGHGDKVMRGG